MADKCTASQIVYAKDLLAQLGYEWQDYDFQTMTKAEASTLISELKAELEG